MRLNLLDKNSNASLLLSGIFLLIIGLGVARFAFTSLLPPMLEHRLTLNFAGLLASINYFGYLFGAFFAIFVTSAVYKVRFLRLGMLISIVTTALLGLHTGDLVWIVSRAAAGFGSALLVIIGSSLVMSRLHFEDKTKAMGIHFSGIGFAIIITELLDKAVLSYASWHTAWLACTLLGIVLSAYAFYILDHEDKHQKKIATKRRFKIDFFVVALIFSYFTVGTGYAIQGTFLPDIINSLKGLNGFGSTAWLFAGIAGVPASIIWMRLAHRYTTVNVIIAAIFVQIISTLIPIYSNGVILNLLSAILYGAACIGLVALFLNLGGKISKDDPAIMMGALTSAYGIGQITAPLYAVALVDRYKNYNATLYVTAVILFFGIAVLLFYRKKEHIYI
jgi:predicted MFS family arabinose efflux permease